MAVEDFNLSLMFRLKKGKFLPTIYIVCKNGFWGVLFYTQINIKIH